jgi:hypothetical protein
MSNTAMFACQKTLRKEDYKHYCLILHKTHILDSHVYVFVNE